uniref:Cytochrome P450, family 39, subfamily A, polypeptide 1 n=1 Tax=Sinocyclocheilus grahami TaxID=75366 RepID=A0A672S1F7_SINGR
SVKWTDSKEGVLGCLLLFLCTCFNFKFNFRYTLGTLHIQVPLPWFGAAFEFGKAPLHFIQKARTKYGPDFTVVAAGKRLTFVTLNEYFQAFFTSKDVDFEQAVQEAVHNTESVSCLRENRHLFLKNKISKKQIISGNLFLENCFILVFRSVMYPAVMSNLLGRCNSPSIALTRQEFLEKFTTYDEGFEYGSQLPDMFLMYVSNFYALNLLVYDTFSSLVNMICILHAEVHLCSFICTTQEHMRVKYKYKNVFHCAVEPDLSKRCYCIKLSLKHTSVVLKAMDSHLVLVCLLCIQYKEKTKVTLDDLQHMPYVKWCIMEAIRLRAPGAITRKAVRPLKLQNYVIPPGDMLMLSPYWAHRNPKYFPDPEDFKPVSNFTLLNDFSHRMRLTLIPL